MTPISDHFKEDALENSIPPPARFAQERQRSRSQSLDKNELRRASTYDLKQQLRNRLLPPTVDPRDDEFVIASIALDPSHLKPPKRLPLPLLQQDFRNIMAIRTDFKLKSNQREPMPLNTSQAQSASAPKRPKNLIRSARARDVSKNPTVIQKKYTEIQKLTTANVKPASNWRSYPKPWLHGIAKQSSKSKTIQSEIIEIRKPTVVKVPLPPLPPFVLDLNEHAQKSPILARKTSTQLMIQNYEDRQSPDELTFEDALKGVANTLPSQIDSTTNHKNEFSIKVKSTSSMQSAMDEILERRLEQDPYANAFLYHQETESSLPMLGNEKTLPVYTDVEVRADRNGNRTHGYINSAERYNLDQNFNVFPKSTNRNFAQNEVEQGDDPYLGQPASSNSRCQTKQGNRSFRLTPQNPQVYPDIRVPPCHLLQPVRPFVGNFVWDVQANQSGSSFSAALPLYQLNYIPGIHDQFPPPFLPHLPPPRVSTREGPRLPPQSTTNSQWMPQPGMSFAYPNRSVCAEQHAYQHQPMNGYRLNPQHSQPSSRRCLDDMLHQHPSLPEYVSSSHLVYQVPNAPPPSQQTLAQHLIYSQQSIPFSDFQHAQIQQSSDFVNGNINTYNQQRSLEIPHYQTQTGNVPLLMSEQYKHNYHRKLAMAEQLAAEEAEEQLGNTHLVSREMRGRPRQRKPGKDANRGYQTSSSRSKTLKGITAKAKVDSGEITRRPVPTAASISLPNCASELENCIGIRQELKALGKLREDLQSPRSHSADSTCASIRVLLSSRKLQDAHLPRKKVSGRIIENAKHYGHKLCPCYECRRAHGLYANTSQSMSSIEQIDYVRKNIEDLKKFKNVRPENSIVVDSPRGDKMPQLTTFASRKGYGKIPGYLIKRREEIERERHHRLIEQAKKLRLEAEREKQEANRRQFHRMERRRAAAKANFCLFKSNLEKEPTKWNPLESNLDSNYNCFLYVNGKMQSEFYPSPHRQFLKEEPTGPNKHPSIFNLDIPPDNLKPQKKVVEGDQHVIVLPELEVLVAVEETVTGDKVTGFDTTSKVQPIVDLEESKLLIEPTTIQKSDVPTLPATNDPKIEFVEI